MSSDNRHHDDILRDAADTLSSQESLDGICASLCHRGPLPSHEAARQIVDLTSAIVFPGYFGDHDAGCENIRDFMGVWIEKLHRCLAHQIHAGISLNGSVFDARRVAEEKADTFISRLPELRRVLKTDAIATYHGDPAALSVGEVIYCYPGIRAICHYRIAHELVKLDVPVLPRMISEQAHSLTGVDIHPEATIGESLTIDHGTGIVIGATAIVGNNVKIYQGVTLGAKSFDLDESGNPVKGVPRHPIIGNNVIIYSNATILGRITIGDNAVIGGNVWVTQDVEPGERIIQAKANNILRLKN